MAVRCRALLGGLLLLLLPSLHHQAADAFVTQDWRARGQAPEALRGSGRCNIDRRHDLTYTEFEARYRNKRPVILREAPGRARPPLDATKLRRHFRKHAGVPVVLNNPFRVGDVGLANLALGEYIDAFRSFEDREAAAAARRGEGGAARPSRAAAAYDALFDEGASVLHHNGPHGATTQNFEEIALGLARQLVPAPPSAGAEDALRPQPDPLCAVNRGSPEEALEGTPYCACMVDLFVAGQAGGGFSFHYHHSVSGNLQLAGSKRWFLSRYVPPGGHNHRRNMLEWVRTVYPTLPEWAFHPLNASAAGAASDEGATTERQLAPASASSAAASRRRKQQSPPTQPLYEVPDPSTGQIHTVTAAKAATLLRQWAGGLKPAGLTLQEMVPYTSDIVDPEPLLWECALMPGEYLYVPNGFYHGTLALTHEANVAINCGDTMEARRREAESSMQQDDSTRTGLEAGALWSEYQHDGRLRALPADLTSAADTAAADDEPLPLLQDGEDESASDADDNGSGSRQGRQPASSAALVTSRAALDVAAQALPEGYRAIAVPTPTPPPWRLSSPSLMRKWLNRPTPDRLAALRSAIGREARPWSLRPGDTLHPRPDRGTGPWSLPLLRRMASLYRHEHEVSYAAGWAHVRTALQTWAGGDDTPEPVPTPIPLNGAPQPTPTPDAQLGHVTPEETDPRLPRAPAWAYTLLRGLRMLEAAVLANPLFPEAQVGLAFGLTALATGLGQVLPVDAAPPHPHDPWSVRRWTMAKPCPDSVTVFEALANWKELTPSYPAAPPEWQAWSQAAAENADPLLSPAAVVPAGYTYAWPVSGAGATTTGSSDRARHGNGVTARSLPPAQTQLLDRALALLDSAAGLEPHSTWLCAARAQLLAAGAAPGAFTLSPHGVLLPVAVSGGRRRAGGEAGPAYLTCLLRAQALAQVAGALEAVQAVAGEYGLALAGLRGLVTPATSPHAANASSIPLHAASVGLPPEELWAAAAVTPLAPGSPRKGAPARKKQEAPPPPPQQQQQQPHPEGGTYRRRSASAPDADGAERTPPPPPKSKTKSSGKQSKRGK